MTTGWSRRRWPGAQPALSLLFCPSRQDNGCGDSGRLAPLLHGRAARLQHRQQVFLRFSYKKKTSTPEAFGVLSGLKPTLQRNVHTDKPHRFFYMGWALARVGGAGRGRGRG